MSKRHRVGAVMLIALTSAFFSVVAKELPGLREALAASDWAAYDAIYQGRPPVLRHHVPVTLIEIDARSLDELNQHRRVGWPWPRGVSGWADVVAYLERQGARVIVFDLLFNHRSVLGADDDEEFAAAIDAAKVPIVFATPAGGAHSSWAGSTNQFAPPVVRQPILGTVDVLGEQTSKVYRVYGGANRPPGTLAHVAVEASKYKTVGGPAEPFALRFHGPHVWTDGSTHTYRSVRASAVLLAAMGALDLASAAPAVDDFQGRIVIIGGTAAALHDLKATPVAARYPGVAVHATAIDNLLHNERVEILPTSVLALTGLLAGLLVALVTVVGRSWFAKLAPVLMVSVALWVISSWFMHAESMYWLAPGLPATSIGFAAIGGLVWSYRLEDARGRMLLKAIARSVSPAVANAVAADPDTLVLGGKQREITLMFTDMQGFSEMAERLGDAIEPLLNGYLGDLSRQAMAKDGTIDKFIGDAMMAFWNAPLSQPDHALRACRAALAIVGGKGAKCSHVEGAGGERLVTRIGLHTGMAVVGFFGSSERLSYTAVGDAVNVAARLEPANKLYGTQILLSQETADAVRHAMLIRPVDRLCVYGRPRSCNLYTLLGDRTEASLEQVWLCQRTEEALTLYRARDWIRSRNVWLEILGSFPDDQLARVYLDRIDDLERNPPEAGWDGTYIARDK